MHENSNIQNNIIHFVNFADLSICPTILSKKNTKPAQLDHLPFQNTTCGIARNLRSGCGKFGAHVNLLPNNLLHVLKTKFLFTNSNSFSNYTVPELKVIFCN